jgi:DNA-binding NarL/FixJ family response regulator
MKIYIANSERRSTEELEGVIPRIPGIRSAAFFKYSQENDQFIKQFKPDIVIMDNFINGVFDMSLMDQIDQHAPNALKIIYTGLENKKYQIVSPEFGVDHFVYKNAGTEYLKFVIWDHIQNVHAEHFGGNTFFPNSPQTDGGNSKTPPTHDPNF